MSGDERAERGSTSIPLLAVAHGSRDPRSAEAVSALFHRVRALRPELDVRLSYLDHVCSYASNEIAINWNAPLVYVAAALSSLQR